jgi:hypothetical protein
VVKRAKIMQKLLQARRGNGPLLLLFTFRTDGLLTPKLTSYIDPLQKQTMVRKTQQRTRFVCVFLTNFFAEG